MAKYRLHFISHAMAAILLVGVLTPVKASSAQLRAVDSARSAGIAYSGETWTARPVDYDVDRDQDIWIGYHDQGGRLWRNNGSGFYTAVTTNAWPRVNAEGKIPDRHDCVWADVDKNGLPDAYCTAGRGGDNSVKYGKDNELWLQESVGNFRDVGTQWGMGELCGRSHTAAVLDANRDSWPDIFVSNAVPRVVSDPCDDPATGLPSEESKLFINRRGQGFDDLSASYGIQGHMGVWFAEPVDYNTDGYTDLLAHSDHGIYLLRNNAGLGFTNVARQVGLPTTTFADARMGDLNRDGTLDIVAIHWPKVVYIPNVRGTFGSPRTLLSVTAGQNVALGDADGDTDLDVFVHTGNNIDRSNPNDTVLINTNGVFSKVAVPAAGGIGDDVVVLDGNRDGKTEFLVLNGSEDSLGPIQLIKLVLAP
jgi:hypothetical protein